MSVVRKKFLIPVVGVLAVAFSLSVTSGAGATAVDSGAVQFQITNKMTKHLKKFKIGLAGVNAARLSGNRIVMSTTSGDIQVQTNQPGPYDPVIVTGVTGWVNLAGRLRFLNNRLNNKRWKKGRRAGRSIKSVIMDFRVNLSNGVVKGRFGRKSSRWIVMRFDRSKLQFGGTVTQPTVSNMQLFLTSKAKQRLGAKTANRAAFRNVPMFSVASFSANLAP